MKRHALSASSIREHLLLSVFDRGIDASPVDQGRLPGTATVSVGKSRAARSAAIDVSGSRSSKPSKADRIDPAPPPQPHAGDRASRGVPSPSERVRHRFAISHAEYELLSVLKARMAWIDRPTKRGELLRAGLVALSSLSDAELRDTVDRLPRLMPVKPGKSAKSGQKKRSSDA